MKVALKIILLLGIVVYLVFAITKFNRPDNGRCESVSIVVADSAQAGFITSGEVATMLRTSGLYPVGKSMSDVKGADIEKRLMQNPFISKAVCYKNNNVVNVSVSQRLPVIRVMDDRGNSYYVDSCGRVMPRMNYSANLVVVTGHVTPQYARKYLVNIGRYLQQDAFWNDQIEQFNVDAQGNLEMIPRVGDQVIYLGEPVNFPEKMKRLKAFYDKVMGTVGWNKYARINLEFDNQIICTKK